MFKIGDRVKVVSGQIFLGHSGRIIAIVNGYFQVKIEDFAFEYDFTEDELEHA